MRCRWEIVILPCMWVRPPQQVSCILRGRLRAHVKMKLYIRCLGEESYWAVVVRSVVLPVDGLCGAGLTAALPSFLGSFLAAVVPSVCLASAVLAPLCLAFFLLGSYSGKAAKAAICSGV